MASEWKVLRRDLIVQGFDVEETGGGHLKVSRNGKTVGILAGTPGRGRAWQNAIAMLRRGGYQPSGRRRKQ